MAVLNDRGFGHIDGQLADIGNIVANTLEVFGHKQQTRIARRVAGSFVIISIRS